MTWSTQRDLHVLAQRLMFYASRVAVRSISFKKQIQTRFGYDLNFNLKPTPACSHLVAFPRVRSACPPPLGESKLEVVNQAVIKARTLDCHAPNWRLHGRSGFQGLCFVYGSSNACKLFGKVFYSSFTQLSTSPDCEPVEQLKQRWSWNRS